MEPTGAPSSRELPGSFQEASSECLKGVKLGCDETRKNLASCLGSPGSLAKYCPSISFVNAAEQTAQFGLFALTNFGSFRVSSGGLLGEYVTYF